ncbi:MAG: carbohydrate binding domain-containing protein [Planctomycetota bacterium]|jgi:hypothetical protein
MRFLCSVFLAAASVAALATPSLGAKKKDKGKKEAERLKTALFHIVLVVSADGVKSLEAIEPMKMRDRQKELMQAYLAEMKIWRESKALFRKSPENRGQKFDEPAPVPPNLKVMQSRIRGKEKADGALKVLDEKWLKPLLEKEKALAKAKAEEAARKDPRKNPDFLPKGNQVMNGGFEERKSKDSLADCWTGGQWGGPGKKYSVRRSKMNPREGGEYSIVLYSMTEGAKPGVSTAVKLPPAKYQIRFWACADAGKTAKLQASFGGKDLQNHAITDKWQQFRETVAIEKRSFQTKLQIWTDTNRVRVYLDDVEVEVVK